MDEADPFRVMTPPRRLAASPASSPGGGVSSTFDTPYSQKSATPAYVEPERMVCPSQTSESYSSERYPPHPAGTMRMDQPAIAALELLRNALLGDRTVSELAKNTRTPEGPRLITKNILQPMMNEEEINLHHDAVESLCGDEDVFRKLRDWLKEFERPRVGLLCHPIGCSEGRCVQRAGT
ncbi:hypothetical protein QBC41DRAFT_301662 [Cercophora samala]|uniref:DNA mismatch repair protein MutS core domain-containing protein n=1 Tax=Cercophora samala TaxID=330535 RepID=A0AA39ZFV6_9PEZI|nr:hypothetical protein QBC41DRAFT_301662 [Cercophora samala]